MAFVPPKDRVLEHSTSNSQTVFTVTGALDASFKAFSAFMSVGDSTIGAVVEPGVAFRSGLLTYSAANEITVTTTYENTGTFSSSGVKEVFMGLPASRALMVDGAQTLTSGQKSQARTNIGMQDGHLPAIASNVAASAGEVGELIRSSGTSGSLTGTAIAAASITLTAGDWDISAEVQFNTSGGTSVTDWYSSISLTSASVAAPITDSLVAHERVSSMADHAFTQTHIATQVLPSASTTYYLNVNSTFTGTAPTVSYVLRARRMR